MLAYNKQNYHYCYVNILFSFRRIHTIYEQLSEDETVIPHPDQLELCWVTTPGSANLTPIAVTSATSVTAVTVNNSVLPTPPPRDSLVFSKKATTKVTSEDMSAALTEAANLVNKDISDMPVLSITESDFNPSQSSTSDTSKTEKVAAPNFLPTGCDVEIKPVSPKNFYDSLQNSDSNQDCELIELQRPSKRQRIDSLRNEISVMAARLYQIVDELDDLKNN